MNSGWDITDTPYSPELLISNRANGYRDLSAKIDLSSFRRLPWENNSAFFLVSFYDQKGDGLSACPRGLLEKVCKTIKNEGEGWECMSGAELEVSLALPLKACREKRHPLENAVS